MEQLDSVRKTWNQLGHDDAMFSIYTERSKAGNKWSVEDFFETGTTETGALIEKLDAMAPQLRRDRVLDFGCGVGRLTRALAHYFKEAVGVDVAASMIEAAREYNRSVERCSFHVNTEPDLRVFDSNSFDLIYSNMVLQHMPVQLAIGYIREFARLCKPGGLAVFQVPQKWPHGILRTIEAIAQPFVQWLPQPAIDLYCSVRSYVLHAPRSSAAVPGISMQMHGLSKERVTKILRNASLQLAQIESMPHNRWSSYLYYARKPA